MPLRQIELSLSEAPLEAPTNDSGLPNELDPDMSSDDMLPKECSPSNGRTGRVVDAWEVNLGAAAILPASMSEPPIETSPTRLSIPSHASAVAVVAAAVTADAAAAAAAAAVVSSPSPGP